MLGSGGSGLITSSVPERNVVAKAITESTGVIDDSLLIRSMERVDNYPDELTGPKVVE